MNRPEEFSYDLFPKDLNGLFTYIESSGYELVLVGGAVRDYILTGELSHDLDFELRKCKKVQSYSWQEEISSLGKLISKQFDFQVEELPYGILRILINEFEIELCSPRLEFYETGSEVTHKGFSSELDPCLDYNTSFKRRDFTANAIGLELSFKNRTLVLVDPLDGLADLENKLLNTCGVDFSLDPVRFLRAIRFKLKLDCFFSEETTTQLKKMNLNNLSLYYFFDEFFKSKDKTFFRDFFELVNHYEIPLNSVLADLYFLGEMEFSKIDFSGATEFFVNLIFQNSLTSLQLEKLSSSLNIKESLGSRLTELKNMIERGQMISTTQLYREVSLGDIDNCKSLDSLIVLANLYSSRKKFNNLWPHISLFIDEEINDLIPDELKGAEIFKKLCVDNTFLKSELSLIRLYSHLREVVEKSSGQ